MGSIPIGERPDNPTVKQVVFKCVAGFDLNDLEEGIKDFIKENWNEPYYQGQATAFALTLIGPLKAGILKKLETLPYYASRITKLKTLSKAKNADELVSLLKAVNNAGKVFVKSWDEAVKVVDDLIKPQINSLKSLYPDAKMGYRGSLATGKKYSTGGPFDPSDWDVDAFIVSDELASKIGGTGFRNGRDISAIEKIADDLELHYTNISGYRTEIGKPFTFRVWTQAEFDKIVKPNGFKLFE
jgi:hypothetical protein